MPSWRTRFITVLAAASAVDAGSAWALAHLDLGPWPRLAVALLPVPGNLALIAMALVRIRSLDEFWRRVHFEAVVFAFLATGVAVFIYGFLRQADLVSPLDAARVWVFMGATYAIGYGLAIRQYR